MQKDDYPDLISFEGVARQYLKEPSPAKYRMDWFASESLALPEAIERSCASIGEDGSLHPHQWRPFHIWPEAPRKATDLLRPLEGRIAVAHNFDDDLHPLICAALKQVKGIGPLACYDIAHRIGARLRPRLEPTEVFLHRGTREGAKAVGVSINRERAPITDFPKGLQELLTAAQMEDMLCIYRGTLARIAGGSIQGGAKVTARGITRCAPTPAPPRASRPGRC
jgi:hypothetical protein